MLMDPFFGCTLFILFGLIVLLYSITGASVHRQAFCGRICWCNSKFIDPSMMQAILVQRQKSRPKPSCFIDGIRVLGWNAMIPFCYYILFWSHPSAVHSSNSLLAYLNSLLQTGDGQQLSFLESHDIHLCKRGLWEAQRASFRPHIFLLMWSGLVDHSWGR